MSKDGRKDGHHIGSSIEYLTHDEHVKKHGGRPKWLIGSNGSWKRDKKRQRRKLNRESSPFAQSRQWEHEMRRRTSRFLKRLAHRAE